MNYWNLLRHFFKLRKNTQKSREEIASLREGRLREMLRYAYEHSAYHRRRFTKAGIGPEQLDTLPLSAFPTMDKAELLSHFDELVTVPDLHQEDLRRFDEESVRSEKIYKGKYHVVHSSGSTGRPGYFVYDEDAWGQMLSGIVRGALWDMSTGAILKLLLGVPRIVYIAATDGRYGGAMAVGDGIDGVGAKQLFLDIKTPLDEWVRNVERFQPNLIIGYPSAVKILGELAEQGKVSIRIQRVITCGEPLNAGLRDYLEKTFGSEVINFYGASESLALGVEDGSGDGLYLFDDLNYIEAEDGVMYLTCLYNRVQPLIRYRISDQLTLKDHVGDGRYPFTRAETLLGRDENLLWFTDESGRRDFLHPLAIEGFCIEGLRDFQFQQTGPNCFEMLAEVVSEDRKEHVSREMLHQMAAVLQEKRLDYVRFGLRFVTTIQPDLRTGKKKLIVKGA